MLLNRSQRSVLPKPGATANTAYVTEGFDGVIPFLHIAALIERSVITSRQAEGPHVGQCIDGGEISRTRDRVAIVHSVGQFIIGIKIRAVRVAGTSVAAVRLGVTAGGIKPITVAVTALPRRLIIGRLVPFVLAGNPNLCPGILCKAVPAQRAVQRVGAILGCASILHPGGLSVVHPVDKARRIKPTHIRHGPVAAPDH